MFFGCDGCHDPSSDRISGCLHGAALYSLNPGGAAFVGAGGRGEVVHRVMRLGKDRILRWVNQYVYIYIYIYNYILIGSNITIQIQYPTGYSCNWQINTV